MLTFLLVNLVNQNCNTKKKTALFLVKDRHMLLFQLKGATLILFWMQWKGILCTLQLNLKQSLEIFVNEK